MTCPTLPASISTYPVPSCEIDACVSRSRSTLSARAADKNIFVQSQMASSKRIVVGTIVKSLASSLDRLRTSSAQMSLVPRTCRDRVNPHL